MALTKHDNAQIATDHNRLLVVAHSLSNHANDQAEVEPTLDALLNALGTRPPGRGILATSARRT